jgi:hypothetical protein
MLPRGGATPLFRCPQADVVLVGWLVGPRR